MNRTKYYWALVECDSVSTASWLYDQMDGLEADGAGLSFGMKCDQRCLNAMQQTAPQSGWETT